MKDCLIDVLNARDTVLHVFSIAVEDQDGLPRAVDPEREALKLAALMQLVPETETAALHTRRHINRGGPLTPYSDALEIRLQKWDRIEQHIRERAYFLWQNEGCPDNRADQHWHLAREFEGNAG